MPEIKRIPEKQTPETPYVAEYKCKCGKEMEYQADGKPARFRDLLCFDCQDDSVIVVRD